MSLHWLFTNKKCISQHVTLRTVSNTICAKEPIGPCNSDLDIIKIHYHYWKQLRVMSHSQISVKDCILREDIFPMLKIKLFHTIYWPLLRKLEVLPKTPRTSKIRLPDGNIPYTEIKLFFELDYICLSYYNICK